jgi:hypothetical protein
VFQTGRYIRQDFNGKFSRLALPVAAVEPSSEGHNEEHKSVTHYGDEEEESGLRCTDQMFLQDHIQIGKPYLGEGIFYSTYRR